MTNRKIAAEALSLLLRQSLAGRYSLSLFDVRKTVTGGRAIINSISEYEKTTGERLSSRPEGFTVKSGSLSLIFYDDRIQSRERINWTLAHELLRRQTRGKRGKPLRRRISDAGGCPPFPRLFPRQRAYPDRNDTLFPRFPHRRKKAQIFPPVRRHRPDTGRHRACQKAVRTAKSPSFRFQ